MSKNTAISLFLAAVTIVTIYTMVHFALAGIQDAFAPLDQLHQK
jgi:hypothetical protein